MYNSRWSEGTVDGMPLVAFTHPDYTILRELGRGGSAAVYLAVQKSLNRRVAIKVLHGLAGDPANGERFLREGRIIAKLNHPNIVPVYDVGALPGDASAYFMTMEYLPGGTLSEQDESLTLNALFSAMGQVCAALSYAHEQGFVHRDVKPDNVLFRGPGEALLADFGIARATESQTQLTMTGAMLGTPDYMSPEQVTGGDVDPRSDLYSLGIVLFEMLAGYRPLQGDSVVSTGLQHLAAPPLPLPENVAHFQPLMDRLLAKKPEERIASAQTLAQELASLAESWAVDLEQPIISLHSGEAPQRVSIEATLNTGSGTRTNRFWVSAGLVVLVAIAATGFYVTNNTAPTLSPTTNIAEPALQPSELELALDAAQQAFRLDQWFGEGPDTAVALFRQVQELDPENAQAISRLADLFDTTFNRATSAISVNDFSRADTLLVDLRQAWPNDPRVVQLEQDLSSAQSADLARQQQQASSQRISGLLAQASGAMAQGALIEPVDTSAATYYQQVLAVEANNVLATSGLTNIATQLFNQVDRAVSAGEFKVADQLVEDVASIFPDNLRLADMRAQIKQARDASALALTQQAEQAQLATAIGALSQRIDAWVLDERSALDEIYTGLSADMSSLLTQAPDNTELRSMRAVAQRHADRLTAAATQAGSSEAAEGGDEDQFRFGSF